MDNITEIEKLFRKHSRKSPITYNEFLEAGWTKENYFEYLRHCVMEFIISIELLGQRKDL